MYKNLASQIREHHSTNTPKNKKDIKSYQLTDLKIFYKLFQLGEILHSEHFLVADCIIGAILFTFWTDICIHGICFRFGYTYTGTMEPILTPITANVESAVKK